jgi:hypothetical protein
MWPDGDDDIRCSGNYQVAAIAEVGRKTMCMISLDFKGAFDAISHEFMEEVLLKYGYSARIARRIMGLYEGATSSIQMKGYIYLRSIASMPLSGKVAL